MSIKVISSNFKNLSYAKDQDLRYMFRIFKRNKNGNP